MEHICYASEAVSLGCEKKLKYFFSYSKLSELWKSRLLESIEVLSQLNRSSWERKKGEAAVWSADWQTAKTPTVVVEKN